MSLDIFQQGGLDLFGNNMQDDSPIMFGGAASLLWETADANANELVLALPNGGATDVPVFVIGDQGVLNVDLAAFNAQTEPRLVIYNDAANAYIAFDAGDDAVAQSKGVYFKAAADEDIELLNLSVTGTPRVFWDESEDKFRTTKGIYLTGGLVIDGSESIDTRNAVDGDSFTFRARDSDTDLLVSVAQVKGASDPYFGLGGSGAHKFTNSDKAGFFGVTPVAQQTGCAVPTDLTTAITAIEALRTALNNLGLTTVV